MPDQNLFHQLQTRLALMDTALEAVETAVVFTNPAGVVSWCNRAFRRMVKTSGLAIIGAQITAVLPEGGLADGFDHAGADPFWRHAADGCCAWQLAACSTHILQITWTTLYLPTDSAMVFAIVERPESHHFHAGLLSGQDKPDRQVENFILQLQQARDQAIAASQSKTRFLASLSHEIRTPLNAVIGMAELLSETPMRSDQKEMVGTIRDGGAHLLELINDVLELAQIDEGFLRLRPRAFNLSALLDQCHSLFKNEAAKRGLSLTLAPSPELPTWLYGDDRKLRQIISNLLSNACKYTPSGSVQLAAVASASQGNVLILSIQVRDTGVGIASDQLPLIFEDFTRASDTALSRQSAGLGLAICARLCECMGGTIHVETRRHAGSCFTVQLPFLRTHQPRSVAASAVGTPGARSSRGKGPGILVADDSRVNQRVLQLMLSRLNLEAEVVGDGEEAIARIEAGGIDLVLMDVEMPVLDGITATRRLRASGFAGLYVIALTAHTLVNQRRQCQSAGMNDFLTKPLRPDDLRAALGRFQAWCRGADGAIPG